MIGIILRHALIAGALLIPSQAIAGTYQFTVSGNASATFSLDSSPTPSSNGVDDFTIAGVNGTFNGTPTTFDLLFYDSAEFGGFDISGLLSLAGDQLFTGSTNSPTFVLGTFPLSTYGSTDNAYSLTISSSDTAVPEPGSWAMMLFGLGALGLAVRRSSGSAKARELT
jgi:hypothetical protein